MTERVKMPGLPPALPRIAAAVTGLFVFCVATGADEFTVLGMATAAMELAFAALVLMSAGGWGYLALRRLLGRVQVSSSGWHPQADFFPLGGVPTTSPKQTTLEGATPLRCFTAIGVGLWLLSTAVLVAGSIIPGSLSQYVWWPVVIVGDVLALWQAWPVLREWKPGGRVHPTTLIWLLAAVAAGLLLAGAMRPPGSIGMFQQGDAYDVLEYHLQLPRQYFEAGHIAPQPTNCYSYYPLGTEMLFLLAMCLHGGAYDGVYLATVLHGVHGVLAVAAIYLCLRRADKARAPFAAVLLATVPGMIYLGWLAKTELSQVFYLTMALLWLREWPASLRHPIATAPGPTTTATHPVATAPSSTASWRPALCIGLMIGGACATKYTAIGLVAIPVLASMAMAAVIGLVKNRRWPKWGLAPFSSFEEGARPRFWPAAAQVFVAGLLVLVMLAPWMVRNAAAVGNPLFPLATAWLGRGYWTPELQQRWADGNGPRTMPPVPVPPHWQPRTNQGHADMLVDRLFVLPWRGVEHGQPFLSGPLILLALLAVVVTLARWLIRLRHPQAEKNPLEGATEKLLEGGARWDPLLVVVLAVQIGIWALGSKEMPWRFILPAVATMALLAGGLMGDLAAVCQKVNRWVGFALAGAVLLAVCSFNLFEAWGVYRAQTQGFAVGPIDPQELAKAVKPYSEAAALPPGSRLMLIGEAQAFYFPNGTVYATVFDPHPLELLIRQDPDPAAVLRGLRRMGVTHLYFDWGEILRLASTYGYPPDLSWGLIEAREAGKPPTLPILEQLAPLGLKLYRQIDRQGAPPITIYELPAAP